jgi:acetyl-CoA carboxylase carboxyltransferase component
VSETNKSIDENTSPLSNGVEKTHLKNNPPVGILRAQQYESIASNLNSFATPSKPQQSQSPASNTPTNNNNNSQDEAINILNIFVREFTPDYESKPDDETLARIFHEFVQSKLDTLKKMRIRRLTFTVGQKRQQPAYFTFRARDTFNEDKIYRHLEPALAFQLEIYRLRSFHLELIPTSNLKIHLYLGKAKVAKGTESTDYRFFARCIIRHSDLITKEASYEYLQSEAERTLLEALNELECAFSHPMANKTDCNHIYMCFVPCVCIDAAKVEESVRSMVLKYGLRLWKLRVLQAELKMTLRFTPDGEKVPIRIFLTNESGYYLDISLYREITDKTTGEITFESYSGKPGPFHGRMLRTPYFTRDHLQQKRFAAQTNGTTYVYDFPEMFRQALMRTWKVFYTNLANLMTQEEKTKPKSTKSSSTAKEKSLNELNNLFNTEFFSAIELVIDPKSGELIEKNRLPGENNIGMIAWKINMKTPEYPNGRQMIVIANDLTCKIGSFGMEEDLLFKKASELARKLGIPRIYLSANSGARIGLAEELKELYRVAWYDEKNPDKGFKYLYLTEVDYHKLNTENPEKKPIINFEQITDELSKEKRYRIVDIFGKENGIGVENLRGSGMIAGETSQAYNEICTISLVTCRSVGIGAYLVRLGQRVVQVENSHIILTGSGALNKVLGREVYTSNAQLGGVQIMHNNGVSHGVVSDDFEGVCLILKWLSFMPNRIIKHNCSSLPILIPMFDPIDRPIEFKPTKTPYDPRWMLEGRTFETIGQQPSHYISGFFDRDSYHEIMSQWAKTVVCGRARLGGIPVGVIAVETRTVDYIIPADPANLDSDSKSIQQAGQVWFPDSAYKTSQAIRDFSRECLPLMIFANWRGFSGGMKDMYEQVLKFGAYIVDALREYQQPVMIYIPPNGELRGGAWVVVDSTINERYMEMYADKESRGNVLEPEGTVEIKYRAKDLIKAMHRLDPQCADLVQKIDALKKSSASKEELQELEKKLEELEKNLMPLYHQVSVTFADLHDTPGRMLQKNVINDVIEWDNSRLFFYWRLRRLLVQDLIVKQIILYSADVSFSFKQAIDLLRKWFDESNQAAKNEVRSLFFILLFEMVTKFLISMFFY